VQREAGDALFAALTGPERDLLRNLLAAIRESNQTEPDDSCE
jgi:hypothetical protein